MRNFIFILSSIIIHSNLFAIHDWGIISLPSSENLTEIQFVNDSVGFIAGEKGVLLKTTDKGINWSIINTPDTFNIKSLAFISEIEGGILVTNQFNQPSFYVTYNNGSSWQQKPYTLNGLCFPNVLTAVEDKIIIAGNGCFYGDGISVFQNDTIVMDTMLNWFGTIRQFDFIDKNIGFASSVRGSIYKTLDGGLNWETISITDSIVEIYDIAFQDEMNAYIVGLDTTNSSWSRRVVLKTEDGGNTWQDDLGALFVTPKFTDVVYYAEDSVIISGEYEGIFNDNGTVWFNFYGQSVTGFTSWWVTDTNTFKVKKNDLVVQNKCVYIIGDEGFLSTNCYKADTVSDTTTTTGINLFYNQDLELNLFPNPSSNYIEIEMKNVNKGKYTFQIFDVIGKEIYSEIKYLKSINTKKIYLDEIENGSYFLRISNSKGFISKTFQVSK